MSRETSAETAVILRLAPSGESFLKLDLLGMGCGARACLKRLPKARASRVAPELFDTAEIHFETPAGGRASFVSEYRPLRRRPAIGSSYQKLKDASGFCSFLLENAAHMPDPEALCRLTERILDAFAERPDSGIVLFKGLYLILRDEGYPVRESWWPRLPGNLRDPVRELLLEPVPDATAGAKCDTAARAKHHLCEWIRRETELRLPKSLLPD